MEVPIRVVYRKEQLLTPAIFVDRVNFFPSLCDWNAHILAKADEFVRDVCVAHSQAIEVSLFVSRRAIKIADICCS